LEKPSKVCENVAQQWKRGGYTIRVDNLPLDLDTYMLKKAFREFGHILYSRVIGDSSGSKGYGFVQFEAKESALQAIKIMDRARFNQQIVYLK
jgi:RNA recognition motif-containing protein